MKGAILLFALLFALLTLAHQSHALSCMDVDMCVAPCVGYLTGGQSSPSTECCDGVKKLRTLPSNTAEKRFACNCVKSAASHMSNINDNAVKSLPTACGSPLPFPISLEFDCSTIPPDYLSDQEARLHYRHSDPRGQIAVQSLLLLPNLLLFLFLFSTIISPYKLLKGIPPKSENSEKKIIPYLASRIVILF
ncbi:hypothetical protein LUZ60_000826 [Juncus effusus]|nr:hypothetical protein LUZ60_000826 [Juncus effusus]